VNALTRDRLTWAVLAVAIILLVAALVGLILWADVQIQRYERRAVDAEAERDDARAELSMWQGAMTGLVEGTAGPMRGPREED
jgi:uncharacterized iron-regulated membrane protein